MFDITAIQLSNQVRNNYHAILHQIEKTKSNEEAKVFSGELLPIHREKNRMAREVEVINLQLIFLKQVLAGHLEDQDLILLNQDYQQKLTELQRNFEEDYHELLKAKNQFYVDGNLVDSNKAERQTALEQFKIDLAEEMKPYKVFSIAQDALIQAKILQLEQMARDKSLTVSILIEEHTRIVDKWRERESFFGKRKNKLDKQKDDFLSTEQQILYQLCEEGDLTKVKACVESIFIFSRKKIINTLNDHNAALHVACLYGHVEVVDYLISMGADTTLADQAGYVPLHYAVILSHKEHIMGNLIELLTKGGAAHVDIEGPYGRTALHTAALFNNLIAVKLLLKKGAEVNKQETGSGPHRTPLHNAASKGNEEIVKLLLENKANPTLKNINNESAVFEAIFYGEQDTARLFFNLGVWVTEAEFEQLKVKAEKSLMIRDALYTPLLTSIAHLIPAVPAANDRVVIEAKLNQHIDELEDFYLDHINQLPENGDDKYSQIAMLFESTETEIFDQSLEDSLSLKIEANHLELLKALAELKTEQARIADPLNKMYQVYLQQQNDIEEQLALKNIPSLEVFYVTLEKILGAKILSAITLTTGMIQRSATKLEKWSKIGGNALNGLAQGLPVGGSVLGGVLTFIQSAINFRIERRQNERYEHVADNVSKISDAILIAELIARRLAQYYSEKINGLSVTQAKELAEKISRVVYGCLKKQSIHQDQLKDVSLNEKINYLMERICEDIEANESVFFQTKSQGKKPMTTVLSLPGFETKEKRNDFELAQMRERLERLERQNSNVNVSDKKHTVLFIPVSSAVASTSTGGSDNSLTNP